MSEKTIKIRYEPQETGPAVLLQGRIARIVDPSFLNPSQLWQDDIVLLDQRPSQEDFIPEIKKVLFTRFPFRADYSFGHDFPIDLFMFLLRAFGHDGLVLFPATRKKQGVVVVGLADDLPLTDLFELMGIPLKEQSPVFPVTMLGKDPWDGTEEKLPRSPGTTPDANPSEG